MASKPAALVCNPKRAELNTCSLLPHAMQPPLHAHSRSHTHALSHIHTHSPSCCVLWLKGSATPLGELFDHGCDSVSTSVIVVGALVALQGGSSMLNFITVFQAVCLFYFAHWECYVKGRVHFNM